MNKKVAVSTAIALLVLVGGISYVRYGWHSAHGVRNDTRTAASASAVDNNLVEIFYLPHAPAVAVVKKVEEMVQKYPHYTVKKYDFDDSANDAVVAAHNLSGHIPVAIFIGGKNTFTIDGKAVTFTNFPQSDAFIPDFGGSWDYADIAKVLTHTAK